MGPLVDYNQHPMSYQNKSKVRQRIIWADEKRIPLAQEDADENDLINQIHVQEVIIHRHVDSSQLKPSIFTNKRLPFGPKYTGEGKLDFYSQNEAPQNETRKEDLSDFEGDIMAQPSELDTSHRAKYVPVKNTR